LKPHDLVKSNDHKIQQDAPEPVEETAAYQETTSLEIPQQHNGTTNCRSTRIRRGLAFRKMQRHASENGR
jgi:hypothetical protein